MRLFFFFWLRIKTAVYESRDESTSDNIEISETCQQQGTEITLTGTSIDVDKKIGGRRIVNFDLFMEKLKFICSHSETCSLTNLILTKEMPLGINSRLYYLCSKCKRTFVINTCDNNDETDYSIEHASVESIMSIGGGYYNLEEFLNTMGIPCMSSFMYDKIHATLEGDWFETAKLDMLDAIKIEIQYAKERGDVTSDGIPFLTVILDGAWSKRSYRVNYNALSGVAVIVGFNTKRVIWMGYRNKLCAFCIKHANDEEIPKHICSKNHSGSSTSMEADIIVEGFKCSLDLYGVIYKRFVADGDSAVFNKLTEAKIYSNVIIEKIECRNHLYRNFETKMADLVKDTKFRLEYRKIIKANSLRFRIAVKSAVAYRKVNHLLKRFLPTFYFFFLESCKRKEKSCCQINYLRFFLKFTTLIIYVCLLYTQ